MYVCINVCMEAISTARRIQSFYLLEKGIPHQVGPFLLAGKAVRSRRLLTG